jgi:photosystem II stability/assembly factor-like uncharacterized protein
VSKNAFGTPLLSIGLILLLTVCAALAQDESGTSKRARRVPPMPHEKKAYDKPAEAADFNLRKRTTGIETRAGARQSTPAIPVERYEAALARIRNMPQYSTVTGQISAAGEAGQALGTWNEIGPSNIGGRTRQLLFDPRNADVMYAAAVAGGVWKTLDGGRSWRQLTDLAIPNIAVNSLAIDPRSPSTLYAGTGEGYFNGDGVRGAGIFKTTDAGTTWTRLPATNTVDFRFVNDVIVSPRSSNRLYAATRSGVWRSTNGGNTWSKVLDAASVLGCFDLVVQPNGDEGFIFASCGTFIYGARSGIYRAADAGGRATWQQVYTEQNIGRVSLAIAPSNQEVLYALAAEAGPGRYQDGLRGVFRSTQAGAAGTWTTQVRNTDANKLNTVLLTNPVFAFLAECHFGPSSVFFNQGWYDNVIAVDPADPNRVWAGGVDLMRSDDGGRNWGVASYWWFSGGVDGTPFDPNYAHADNHVIAFHPAYDGANNKTMFVASDGGVYRTDDARANVGTTLDNVCGAPTAGAVTWRSLNNGYAVTQFYHGTVFPDGETFFGGTQDNGTILGSLRSGGTWREIQGGDGGYVAVDPANTNTLFAEFTGLSITRSTDGGATFTSATSGINNDPGFAFIAPFTMNRGNAEQMMTGGWYIWRTVNQADSWQRASAITPGQGSVSAIGISPVNQNRAVVGMSDGFLLVNHAVNASNHTTSWAFTRPRPGFVSSVHWDPVDPHVVYATYATFNSQINQSHVYRSTDGGRTWSGLDGSGTTGIPDLPVHSLIVDPTNTARLYVGTDAGVFTSIDGGLNWFKEVTGYANVVTEALALNAVGDIRLYAFTHGRSAWRVNLSK